MKWRVTAVLILLGLVGCGSAGLTDRERVFCLNHLDEETLIENAVALGISFSDEEIRRSTGVYGGTYFAYDYVAQDQPWFERVCKASIPPDFE